jgi:glycosyltransferase involved in cell wall biosynthesis
VKDQGIDGYELEVLLINDGSSDGSGEIARSFIEKFQCTGWQLINRPNGGLSSARNLGLEKATGNYIFFLDSDDYLAQDTIRHLVKTATRTGSDLVIGRTKNFSTDDQVEKHYADTLVSVPKSDFTINNYPEITDVVSSCAKLYKKELIKAIQFPDKLVHEDNYFSLLVFDRAKSISINPEAIYYRRIRSDPTNRSITQSLDLKSYVDFLANYRMLIPEISKEHKALMIKLTTQGAILYYMKKIGNHDKGKAFRLAFQFLITLWKNNIRYTAIFLKAVIQLYVTRLTGKY